MLEKDHKDAMIHSAVESCKKSVTLDYDHVDKASFTGHGSAPYGEGGPSAAGPSSTSPGTSKSY